MNYVKWDARSYSKKNIKVYYESEEVGGYFADLLVNDLVIVELKAAEAIHEDHEAQLINYLKATEIEVGLLLNFGKKAEFKRKVFSSARKKLTNKSAKISVIRVIRVL